ncbi:DEAD/DEAH box helicase [Frateuria terrea]|uniref:ATP-dependent RNA helicase RhlB n=1 Tax=Frateuria terrea TaxID=529704 RepID=A0A1H6SCN9_9GAMM|nr:DEAD/DEAH box helicase [Frateuria terrea]SEI63674.1 ATP-dependent RNA helicase RhlB [Frateuria terrea]SFP24181.1 ATP-dependent RNA helicase RhlB [Frateuria terrea]
MSETVLTDTFFTNFDLHPLLQQGLAEAGFTRCTPIQALTLPLALTGRDVAGQAQTGTGKTCAFLVALMNRLLTRPAVAERKDSDPRALIIAPTRELAIQIDKDARSIGRHTGLKTALIYGGVDYDKQRQQLKDGCDIIIATPGRLLDYYKQQVFGFNGVEVMVIDEADRMFDLGFIKDVRFIFRRLPAREQRQVLLYSATLSHRVLELAYEHMHEAEKLVVETDNITADKVRQVVYFPAKEEKMPLLLNLLEREKPSRSIVFVNTKAAAERITERVKRQGYRVGALSGDVPQLKRQKLLQRFQDGQLDMLVCTDVAARGLHIPAVSHVFNYDLPQDAEDYVHRIGRTARLGAEGDAVSFACDLYAMSLPDIEAYIGQKIPVATVEPDLLVMPKPHAIDPQFAEQAAADSEQFGDKVEPRGDERKGPRDGSRRSGRGGERGPREGRPPRAPRPPRDEGEAAVTTEPQPGVVASGASTPATAPAPEGGEGAHKRRRRRGGRGRRREGGENAAPPVQATVESRAPHGERKPPRERGAGPSRPSRQVAVQSGVTDVPSKKPGFFRRLTRLFTGR